ncbi:MAG: metal-sensitive transcriptional regulator [Phycisphaerae bacterium]|nr:metal-sensitive transcriptional regulator [Phycisphaerae bacterium]
MKRGGGRSRSGTAKKLARGSACGCAGGGRAAGVGPGAGAAGVDPAIKRANLTHLRRIEGQVRGIAAMVEQERYCADIITQIAAVRQSLHAVSRNLMRNHLRHCAADAMRASAGTRDRMVEELLDLVGKVAR